MADKWRKEVLKLRDDHTWRSKPGYRIFVADKGAVRFDIPEDWVVKPDSDSIKFHDREPPDDDCVLAASYMRLPPVDWSGLALAGLVETIVEGDERGVIGRGEMNTLRRGALDIAWTEIKFIDPTERREAFSRICLAREANIQSLITFDFWADDRERVEPVWAEVISSLELNLTITDPTRGESIH